MDPNSVNFVPETVVDSHQEGSTEYVGTSDWNKIVCNPVVITQGNWLTTDVTTLYVTDDILNSFLEASSVMRNRLEYFRYLKGTIDVELFIQGNAAAQGRAIMYAFPHAPTQGYQLDYHTRTNSRIVPHVLIDPSQTKTYTLKLPLISNLGIIDLDQLKPKSWAVRLTVYDQLGSGTANVPKISYTIRASLQVEELSGKVIERTIVYGLEKESLKPSDYFSAVSRVLKYPTVRATFGPYTTLFSGLSEATSEALKFFGYSRPQVFDYSPVILRTGDRMTSVDGSSHSVVLGRNQQMHSSIDPSWMNGSMDDMNISHLLSYKVPFAIESINSTQPSGTLVGRYPVSPGLVAASAGASVASYLKQTCRSWNGTIIYDFEFIASVFHRAVFLLAYSPIAGEEPTFQEANTNLEHLIVNVSGNTTVRWEIPWRQANPSSMFNNGEIYVYVLSPVQTNGSEDPIHMDIMMNCEHVNFYFPNVYPVQKPYEVQTYGDWINVEEHKLSGSSCVDAVVVVGGDAIRVVSDLTARAYRVADPTITTTQTVRLAPVVGGTQSYYDIISRWYYGIRGGVRVHVISGVPLRFMLGTTVGYQVNRLNVVTPTYTAGYEFFNTAVINGGDAVVPYLNTDSNFLCMSEVNPVAPQLYITDWTPGDPGVSLLVASGDDYVCGFFLGIPK